MKGGRTREAEHGRGDEDADQGAEAERRRLEELRAREALDLALTGLGTAARAAGWLPRSRRRLDVGGASSCRNGLVASRIQRNPKIAATTAPTATNDLADDQADEDAGDANGEADRPDGRGRLVGGAVTLVRIHVVSGFNRA